ncbi:MAG: hypothetical protein PHF44_00565 [Candidatus Pacebacteria bacterium]|nr:hypothetical protein [Candidatus Paceibacterota bacterium]
MTLFTFNVIKFFSIAAITASLSFLLAPFLIKLLYKFKFWKKEARAKTITGEQANIFYSLHKEKEVGTPRGGGLLIWISVLLVIFLFFGLSFFPNPWWLKKINFLSRSGTWLPLFALVAGSIVGLIDDALTVFGKGKYIGGGMSFKRRLSFVFLIGLIGGLWFYFLLGWKTIHIPLIGNFPQGVDFTIGIWIIPLFILVMLASWSGGVVDGLDGLAGGVFATIFGAFSIIAFSQGQSALASGNMALATGKFDLATFCLAIVGALFTFLWFNIPPARFFMSETGILGLTSTMTVVAFLTDSVVVLPIIAGILVLEVGSIILQLLSKKFRHKKIWLSTPIHHHFEAKGWPSYKVTMRFWIISVILAVIGVAIRLL